MSAAIRTIIIMLLLTVFSTLLVACSVEEAEPEGVIPQGYKDAIKKAENITSLLQNAPKSRVHEAQ